MQVSLLRRLLSRFDAEHYVRHERVLEHGRGLCRHHWTDGTHLNRGYGTEGSDRRLFTDHTACATVREGSMFHLLQETLTRLEQGWNVPGNCLGFLLGAGR